MARHVSLFAGLLAATTGYLLEARFYKWYVWLFPLGTIWLLDRASVLSPRARRRWIAITGLWVGLGWLFRWDVGTTRRRLPSVFLARRRQFEIGHPRSLCDWAAFGLPFLIPPGRGGLVICSSSAAPRE